MFSSSALQDLGRRFESEQTKISIEVQMLGRTFPRSLKKLYTMLAPIATTYRHSSKWGIQDSQDIIALLPTESETNRCKSFKP